jgi:hypothetical protein
VLDTKTYLRQLEAGGARIRRPRLDWSASNMSLSSQHLKELSKCEKSSTPRWTRGFIQETSIGSANGLVGKH